MLKRIGILTGGGDCPGLNPAIKWVVKTALDRELEDRRAFKFEVVGIRDGWRGMVKYDPRHPVLPAGSGFKEDSYARILTEEEVRTWDRLGGTRLGTSRDDPCAEGAQTWPQVVANYRELGLDVLVAIGGDDTLRVAPTLIREGCNIICIPKTIDRDLPGTDYTLGFETAVGVIVEEIDRIRTTAHSHSRTFVVETMGRCTGHLALSGGLAAGADVILIPEVPYRVDEVVRILKEQRDAGQRYAIVVVSEGSRETNGGEPSDRPAGGDLVKTLSRQLEKGVGGEVRSVVLSHLQRGGVPCSYDRRMARSFGIKAVDLICLEQFGRMVVFKDGIFADRPFPEDPSEVCEVDVDLRYDITRYRTRSSLL
jgi:ATP-dependent phosphofructokinase / diphosphate-dependent phosphofructokinase